MKVFGSLVLLVFISACGGGTVSSTPPASSTPTTDPSTSTQTNSPASRFEDSKFGSSTFN